MTPAGRELLNDASAVVDDAMKNIIKRTPKAAGQLNELIELLQEFER
jgi:hypothetical protein